MFDDFSLNNSLKLLKNDKSSDKLKGAKELEIVVRKLSSGEDGPIKEIIKTLTELVDSRIPNHRIGGLVGISATAISLNERTTEFVDLLLPLIFPCFDVDDSRVRFFACEALTNIAHLSQQTMMPHFAAIFDSLFKISNDPDNTVISAFTVLDRLVKDIVMAGGYSQVETFVPRIKAYMYPVNPCSSLFLISWLNVFNEMADLYLVDYLVDILDGIFIFLELNETEIILQTVKLLSNLLDSVESRAASIDFENCAHIVLRSVLDQKKHIKEVGIQWLHAFLRLSGKDQLSELAPRIFEALISCIVPDSNTDSVIECAGNCLHLFYQLVSAQGDFIYPDDQLVTSMLSNLKSSSLHIRAATLRTLTSLIEHIPYRILYNYDSFFTVILIIFEDIVPARDAAQIDSSSTSLAFDFVQSIVTTEAVTQLPANSHYLSTEWWRELSASHQLSPFFNVLISRLVDWFKWRNSSDHVALVITELAQRIDPSTLYRSFAVVLHFEEDLAFISKSVKVLNLVMMTCPAFSSMRRSLRTFTDLSIHALFMTLYKTWAYNPVSLVALCLLTGNYGHALCLVEYFSLLEMDLELLVDIDKLVQLIELPVFAYLRLQLVEPCRNGSLLKCLYGLLMLMPQTKSFDTLYRRLRCVPQMLTLNGPGCEDTTDIDFDELRKHFLATHGL